MSKILHLHKPWSLRALHLKLPQCKNTNHNLLFLWFYIRYIQIFRCIEAGDSFSSLSSKTLLGNSLLCIKFIHQELAGSKLHAYILYICSRAALRDAVQDFQQLAVSQCFSLKNKISRAHHHLISFNLTECGWYDTGAVGFLSATFGWWVATQC